jgi:hypothetical protein
LIILIIGLIILILAPIWKWGIGPSLVKVPDTINTTSIYDGTLTLYVDPSSFTLLPPSMAVKIPLVITRLDLSQPNKSSSSVALVKETAVAIGPAGKKFIDTTMYYALDRKTSENVADHGSDANRTGWYPILPIGAKKQTYPMWGDSTGKTGDAKYVKTTMISGLTTPATTCYVYQINGAADPTVSPPLGLASSMTGAQIKALASGIPGLNPADVAGLGDTTQYPITYLDQTTATVIAEPRTGSVVDAINADTYTVDASAVGIGKIKLATIHYTQTPENVAKVMDDTAKNFGLLNMVGLWIPLALLIVGLVVTIIGLILFLRKKPAPAA